MRVEIWKPLPTNPIYEVSNFGNVKTGPRTIHQNFKGSIKTRIHNSKSVAITDNGRGYKIFSTVTDFKRKNWYLHRAVAELFCPNPYGYPEVNHEDGDKSNNNDWNLKWVTEKQNKDHAVENDLIPHGESSAQSKLTEIQVIEILNAHRLDPKVNRTELGKKYKVFNSAISRIILGKRWRRTYKKFHSKEAIEQGVSVTRNGKI